LLRMRQKIREMAITRTNRLYEFFVTVPIEQVARLQYETIVIIFHLDLQIITIAFCVVK